MDQKKNIGIIFEIICWDTGKYVTPYYTVEVLNENGSLDYSLELLPNNFKISSLLPNLDNPEFRPIFGPVPVNNPLPIKLIIVCILLILTSYFISLIWNKRVKNKFQKAKYQFLETPKDRALKRFQSLSDKKNVKAFYSEISNISKEYFETKYYLLVLEMTTKEIEINRSLFPFDDSTFSKWVELLRQADLIMYANITVNEKVMEMDKIKLNEIIN